MSYKGTGTMGTGSPFPDKKRHWVFAVACPNASCRAQPAEPCLHGSVGTICMVRLRLAERRRASAPPAEKRAPPGTTPWRVGRKVGRTLYDKNDRLIGMVDTPDMASLVVDAVNGYWGKDVEPEVIAPAIPKTTGET